MEKFKATLINGSNWLVIIFLMTLYVSMGIMKFENGAIVLTDFNSYTWLDWALWAIMTFIPAILSLFISGAFKKEGVKQGKKEIKDIIENYQKYLHVDANIKLRSEKEFLTQGALRDSSKKLIMTLILSFVAGELLISLDADGLLKIIINLSVWAVFGFQAFSKHYEYATTELKEWYIVETGKLKNKFDLENQAKEKEIALKVEEQKRENLNALSVKDKEIKRLQEIINDNKSMAKLR